MTRTRVDNQTLLLFTDYASMHDILAAALIKKWSTFNNFLKLLFGFVHAFNSRLSGVRWPEPLGRDSAASLLRSSVTIAH